ncbi:kinesin-like protein KIF25 [Cetorhinus maximus]
MAFRMEVKRLLEQRLRQLERALRGKEERIVQLETENALLHLKLAKCRGSVKDSREETIHLCRLLEEVRNIQKNTDCQLSQLLAGVKDKVTHSQWEKTPTEDALKILAQLESVLLDIIGNEDRKGVNQCETGDFL